MLGLEDTPEGLRIGGAVTLTRCGGISLIISCISVFFFGFINFPILPPPPPRIEHILKKIKAQPEKAHIAESLLNLISTFAGHQVGRVRVKVDKS